MKSLFSLLVVLSCSCLVAAAEPSTTTLSTRYILIKPTQSGIALIEPVTRAYGSKLRVMNVTSIPYTSSTFSYSTSSTLAPITPTLDVSLQVTSVPAPAETSATSISSRRSNGFSTLAVMGVLAGTAVLLVFALIICLVLRQQKRKRYKKMLETATSSKNNSPSLKNGSLKGIVVTREVESKVVPIRMEDMNDQQVRFSVQKKPS
ncbi:hypothetical protein B0J11DRAFT_140281 [Dendryphion nanum]|uniref:Uncharacterized protein n=1 Tax=Dendryphion nanum TaxID=256645 RepID=A0A9P9D734_9PLEO|nr:hypothetical protein B0J11DRAFT_140281 [Dendryphion nanum]